LEIARKLSGYSLGSADLLRRAMGKKVKSEMDAQEEIFVSGAIKNNIPADQARSIFEKVAKFAGYGFNKAHASAYGVISYQTAFLKANFPTEFLVAAMNLDIDNSDKINIFLQEAKIFGIKIIVPSINESNGYFRIRKNEDTSKSIIFSFGAIKSVTANFGHEMEKTREKGGKFKSIIDFIESNSCILTLIFY
jgi:DNA polymerase-3 subunit alpha